MGSRVARAEALGGALMLALLVLAVSAEGVRGAAGQAPTVSSYNLGQTLLPNDGPLGPVPARLWGVIGVPDEPGRHPLVVVAHGRHGDGCPVDDQDFPTWPCFDIEQRNDFGLRHLVAALARRGLIAVAPDLNAAFTAGWGEPTEFARWPPIVNRTIGAIVREAEDGTGRFGVELLDRLDPRRIAVLGHSLSGFNAARFARRRADNDAPQQIAGGRGPLDSLFLLTPIARNAMLPDLETAVVVASCDGDVGEQGRRYLHRAREAERRRPLFLAELHRANHNYFNRTLARLGFDDAVGMRGACRRARRLGAHRQQTWLDRAVSDFFAATLLGDPRPRWLRLRGRLPSRAYGLRVTIERD
jgi:dienelactone hydrolase